MLAKSKLIQWQNALNGYQLHAEAIKPRGNISIEQLSLIREAHLNIKQIIDELMELKP